jgi:hypothetical protein
VPRPSFALKDLGPRRTLALLVACIVGLQASDPLASRDSLGIATFAVSLALSAVGLGHSILEDLARDLALAAVSLSLLVLITVPRPTHCHINVAATSARALRSVAEVWRSEHADGECPTPEVLLRDHAIDPASKLTDPWDGPFTITCEPDETTVTSRGPDRIDDHGLGDDVRIPALSASPH